MCPGRFRAGLLKGFETLWGLTGLLIRPTPLLRSLEPYPLHAGSPSTHVDRLVERLSALCVSAAGRSLAARAAMFRGMAELCMKK